MAKISLWLEYKIWIGHGKTKLTPTKYLQARYWMIFIVFMYIYIIYTYMYVGLWYWFNSLVYFWFNIYQCRTLNSLHFDRLRWCCFGLGFLGILVQMLPGKRAKCFWDALNWEEKRIEIRIQKLPETWFCRLSPQKMRVCRFYAEVGGCKPRTFIDGWGLGLAPDRKAQSKLETMMWGLCNSVRKSCWFMSTYI